MNYVLVTGGNGQLASCLKDLSKNLQGYKFIFTDVEELDIAKSVDVDTFFKKNNIVYCINCAAYTAVDKAESEKEIAKKVNESGPRNLADACHKYKATLIHISTDFVFSGNQSNLYTEEDSTHPINFYGISKLDGEKAVISLEKHIIIRTSWLYSEYGHNFLKTMLRLGKEKETLSVVCDQIGTPTYAGDLAMTIVKMISSQFNKYGVYHYSNEGVASWYDFAKAIFDETQTNVKLFPISSEAYPTPAKRPAFSVMDKSKIKNALDIEISYWRDSLKECLEKI
ncbi:dTDP-4-dehydrorhamnose reductase [Mariniflexile fucanivorans]|uniref:dTDP-4-dehydrorhamnose reductase n=1 Tax=Mariniflexile fucanivorans TaxID=264023 RepID=A0A4R1RKH8_9FLAO|nr:dTDP-4-dehydrorhamnose reductase [Mariniflexile fucanivorans]TCL66701.1 dTDP-4-dehydrorhamnose reductase [Mariniflexile fucanivorans]